MREIREAAIPALSPFRHNICEERLLGFLPKQENNHDDGDGDDEETTTGRRRLQVLR